MKFELIDKTDKNFSAALGGINDERVEAGKKKKKDELKETGFVFNTDAERNYWLQEFPEDTLNITIAVDGTMVVTKTDNSEITAEEKLKIDAVVKKMYELLDIKENEYHAVAEEKAADTKGIGVGSGSANATSAPAPLVKNYHNHLTTHAAVLNAALNPHHYQVNPANNTIEKLNDSNKPTGHKITINKDGSTKGDLFAKLDDPDLVAQLISEDHIAVVNMHLALLKQGIKPDKKINLFLIKQGLTPEQAKLVPEIEEKIKAHLVKELAKDEYKDIKDYIVYDGVPLEKKPAKAEDKKAAEPEREKGFIEKIGAGEDTGNMWLRGEEINSIAHYALVDALGDGHRISPDKSRSIFNNIPDDSKDFFPKQPRPLYTAMNHGNLHHVLVYIDDKEELHYINSMQGNDEEIKEMLRKKFPGFKAYNVRHSAEQTDGWTCGYRVAREILKLEGLNDHPLVKATTPEDIRNAFINIAKKIVKRFKLKQPPCLKMMKDLMAHKRANSNIARSPKLETKNFMT